MGNNEPTLEQIEDYNNNESTEKRNTVKLVVIGILVLGAVYSFIKFSYNNVDDYIGTSEQPGFNTSKY